MGQAFLYGNGSGSGGASGTLTVSAPAGVTVTLTKGDKTKTRIADSSGVAVFKGLATGTWTMTISDGKRTASKSVVITADYSTTIVFFAATINVTYPAGSTCTASDGTTTLTASDTSGTWACVVPNAGEWTITTTNGEKTKSGTVTIATEGETVNITLAYVLELFKDGAEVVGWSLQPRNHNVSYGNSITLGNIKTQYGEENANRPIFYTTDKVDVADYKTLTAKFSDATGTGNVKIGIMSDVPPSGSNTAYTLVASGLSSSTGAVTLSVDVSSITGEYYVIVTAEAMWTSHYELKTTDVYLV